MKANFSVERKEEKKKPEEEKDARRVTCFMEENEISLREVAGFDEYKRD